MPARYTVKKALPGAGEERGVSRSSRAGRVGCTLEGLRGARAERGINHTEKGERTPLSGEEILEAGHVLAPVVLDQGPA